MIFSIKKKILSAGIPLSLLLQGCQSTQTQQIPAGTPAVKKEIDYQKIFEAALKKSGNRLGYKLQTHSGKDGSVIFTAEFVTEKKTSHQTLEMVLLTSGNCIEDTASGQLKQKNRGIGPSGASSELSFCVRNQSIKLVDSNRLSMSDHPHGIGLVALAKNIQVEAKK